MSIEPTTPEMRDTFAAFGRDLLLLEDKSLGAREIPLSKLLAKATSWLSAEEIVLRKIVCTETHQVKPEITCAVNMGGIIATAIRAHYGDHFPASSASATLMSYGLAKFCAGRQTADVAKTKNT